MSPLYLKALTSKGDAVFVQAKTSSLTPLLEIKEKEKYCLFKRLYPLTLLC